MTKRLNKRLPGRSIMPRQFAGLWRPINLAGLFSLWSILWAYLRPPESGETKGLASFLCRRGVSTGADYHVCASNTAHRPMQSFWLNQIIGINFNPCPDLMRSSLTSPHEFPACSLPKSVSVSLYQLGFLWIEMSRERHLLLSICYFLPAPSVGRSARPTRSKMPTEKLFLSERDSRR